MQNIKDPKIDSTWLVYRESFETDMRQGAASKAVVEYLDAVGYTQTETKPSLRFARGAQLSGLANPDPRNQQVEIVVDLVSMGGNTIVEIEMRVNRFGTVPMQPHFDFWAAELRGIQHALMFGFADPLVSTYAAERAKWFSVAVLLGALILLLIVTASMIFVLSISIVSGYVA